jgi:hypothetical protein
VRLTDTTLFDEAVATTPHAGELPFEKSADRSLSLAMPIVRLERPPIAVEGPGFLDVTYNQRGRCGGPARTSLVPNLLNFFEISNGYGEAYSWFESRSLRHEVSI